VIFSARCPPGYLPGFFFFFFLVVFVIVVRGLAVLVEILVIIDVVGIVVVRANHAGSVAGFGFGGAGGG
jgi:hypothetical protein